MTTITASNGTEYALSDEMLLIRPAAEEVYGVTPQFVKSCRDKRDKALEIVELSRGHAAARACTDCGTTGVERVWSLRANAGSPERAFAFTYSNDPNDYIVRCLACSDHVDNEVTAARRTVSDDERSRRIKERADVAWRERCAAKSGEIRSRWGDVEAELGITR